jgi:hypothetical protein
MVSFPLPTGSVSNAALGTHSLPQTVECIGVTSGIALMTVSASTMLTVPAESRTDLFGNVHDAGLVAFDVTAGRAMVLSEAIKLVALLCNNFHP